MLSNQLFFLNNFNARDKELLKLICFGMDIIIAWTFCIDLSSKLV
jgi:hypothetical protein